MNLCHDINANKSMCLVRKGEKEMMMTMLLKQFGKSVLADCDADRCIQLGRKEWHVKHARYRRNGCYLSTGGIASKEATPRQHVTM